MFFFVCVFFFFAFSYSISICQSGVLLLFLMDIWHVSLLLHVYQAPTRSVFPVKSETGIVRSSHTWLPIGEVWGPVNVTKLGHLRGMEITKEQGRSGLVRQEGLRVLPWNCYETHS